MTYVKYLIYYTHIIEIDNRLNNGDIEMATDKIEKAIKKELYDAIEQLEAIKKELYDAIEQLEAIKREKWSID